MSTSKTTFFILALAMGLLAGPLARASRLAEPLPAVGKEAEPQAKPAVVVEARQGLQYLPPAVPPQASPVSDLALVQPAATTTAPPRPVRRTAPQSHFGKPLAAWAIVAGLTFGLAVLLGIGSLLF